MKPIRNRHPAERGCGEMRRREITRDAEYIGRQSSECVIAGKHLIVAGDFDVYQGLMSIKVKLSPFDISQIAEHRLNNKIVYVCIPGYQNTMARVLCIENIDAGEPLVYLTLAAADCHFLWVPNDPR